MILGTEFQCFGTEYPKLLCNRDQSYKICCDFTCADSEPETDVVM